SERVDDEQGVRPIAGRELIEEPLPRRAGRIQNRETSLLTSQKRCRAAIPGHQEDARNPWHVRAQGTPRLAHHIERLAAGCVAASIADIGQCPCAAEETRRRAREFPRSRLKRRSLRRRGPGG